MDIYIYIFYLYHSMRKMPSPNACGPLPVIKVLDVWRPSQNESKNSDPFFLGFFCGLRSNASKDINFLKSWAWHIGLNII